MQRGINAKEFWDKLATKEWLLEHTSLEPAETYARGLRRRQVPEVLREVLSKRGILRAIIKPHVGRNGRGIVMVQRTHDNRWRTPTKDFGDQGLIHELEHDILPDYPDFYFIEERFSCHPGLKRFTWYPDTIPLFRLLFGEKHGFIVGGMYTASARAKGFAQILVGGTVLWFDEQGIIRPCEDMLGRYEKANGDYTKRTHPDTRYHYKQIEGMAEFIGLVLEEMWPYIRADRNKRWGLDVAIVPGGVYRIVEVNHGPGCQMKRWAGWRPLEHEVKGGFLND